MYQRSGPTGFDDEHAVASVAEFPGQVRTDSNVATRVIDIGGGREQTQRRVFGPWFNHLGQNVRRGGLLRTSVTVHCSAGYTKCVGALVHAVVQGVQTRAQHLCRENRGDEHVVKLQARVPPSLRAPPRMPLTRSTQMGGAINALKSSLHKSTAISIAICSGEGVLIGTCPPSLSPGTRISRASLVGYVSPLFGKHLEQRQVRSTATSLLPRSKNRFG